MSYELNQSRRVSVVSEELDVATASEARKIWERAAEIHIEGKPSHTGPTFLEALEQAIEEANGK